MLVVLQALAFCLVSGDVTEKQRLAKTPVSSSFVGLEVPLVGAAASPQQRKIISLHHNPADENNLERLCNDPFHSFLCKPVGPRRRIDGRLRAGAVLPPGVLTAASNLREEKQPLEEGSALLPTSQVADRTYLPPPNQQPPFQENEPQYLPPQLPPKIETLPSNPSNFYLPVVQITEKPYTSRQQENESRESVTYKPQSKTYLPIKLTQSLTENAHIPLNTNAEPIYIPQNTYLPTDEGNVLPESTNLSPNIEGGALLSEQIKPVSKNNQESHTLERLCNDPFHSFLCKPLKARKRIDGKIRPGAKLPPNFLLTSGSIRRETKVLPTEEGGALLSASLPASKSQLQNVYNTNQNDGQASSLNQHFFTKPKEFNRSPYSPNSVLFPKMTHENRNSKSFKFLTNNTHQLTQSTSKLPTQNVQYLSPTNIKENSVKVPTHGGYVYEKPATELFYNTTPKPLLTIQPAREPIKTTKKANYQFQSPTNTEQSIIKSQESGYYYSKPSVLFTNPTKATTQPTITTTTAKPIYQYPSPTNIQSVVSPQGNGYHYNKPSVLFTYPTKATTQPTITSTTAKPIYQYPSPTNIQSVVSSQNNGYHYNKPSNSFTYPSSSTKTTPQTFFEYPNPSNNLQNVLKQQNSGYTYVKPSSNVPYPTSNPTVAIQTFPTIVTTQAVPVTQRTKPSTILQPRPNYDYPNATNIQQNIIKPQEDGYNFSKPSTIFTYPTKTPSTTSNNLTNIPNAPNIDESIASSPKNKGYNYQMPVNPLSLPTRSNEPQKSSYFEAQNHMRFGDRITPRILPTASRNYASHDEEFKPLRNFELI